MNDNTSWINDLFDYVHASGGEMISCENCGSQTFVNDWHATGIGLVCASCHHPRPGLRDAAPQSEV